MSEHNCSDFLICPGEPIRGTASIYVPIIICFVAFSLAFGIFCRWLGVRRQRRLIMLEALQWEESELVEPTVDYGEKPPIYEVSLKIESDGVTVRHDAMPLSLNPTNHNGAGGQSFEEGIVHDPQSTRHQDRLRQLANLLLQRPRFIRTETPNLPMEDFAHDALSVAFIIAMPGDSRDKFADDGVLPELQLGFRNLDMLGNAPSRL